MQVFAFILTAAVVYIACTLLSYPGADLVSKTSTTMVRRKAWAIHTIAIVAGAIASACV